MQDAGAVLLIDGPLVLKCVGEEHAETNQADNSAPPYPLSSP